jgi:hypothetical protein
MTPETFWSHVDRSAGPHACWPWTGAQDANGYGWLRWHGARARAHRIALEIAGHPVPPGLVGRHLCNNKLCCNPLHLASGTHGDNARDRVLAGHQRSARLLTLDQAAELRRFYRRGLATSTELGRLYGIAPERVRHIGTDESYRVRPCSSTPSSLEARP